MDREKAWFLAFQKVKKRSQEQKRVSICLSEFWEKQKNIPNLSTWWEQRVVFLGEDFFLSFFQARMRKACANPNLLAAESFV